MTTGKTVDIYAKSTNTPKTGEFWTINDAGVITAKTAATEKTVSIDYDGDEYITVSADGKILFNVDKKITKVVTNDYTKADPKENDKDLFKNGKTQIVKYMGVSNGTLVLIYGYAAENPGTGEEDTDKVTVVYNSAYNYGDKAYVAEFDGAVSSDKKSVTGTYTITKIETTGIDAFAEVNGEKNAIGDSRKFEAVIKLGEEDVTDVKFSYSVKDGVATFTFTKEGNISDPSSQYLAAGTYAVTVKTDVGGTALLYFTVK